MERNGVCWVRFEAFTREKKKTANQPYTNSTHNTSQKTFSYQQLLASGLGGKFIEALGITLLMYISILLSFDFRFRSEVFQAARRTFVRVGVVEMICDALVARVARWTLSIQSSRRAI